MWASSPLASAPSPCLPKTTIPFTPTHPVQRCFLVVSKAQRPHNPSAKKIGGLGLGVLAAVKSNPQTKPFDNPPAKNNSTASINSSDQSPKQEQRQQQEEGKPVGKEGRELSGSDVLLALQSSSAQKSKTKKRREYLSSSSRSKKGVAAEVNYGDVRPICVKSEWITRLDELEKRLQELMDEVQVQ